MDTVTAVIETPKGNAEKYNCDPKTKFFKLKKILPTGMVFPVTLVLYQIQRDKTEILLTLL